MIAPTSSLATLRPDIGESLMEFDLLGNMSGFVATRLFRPIEVMEQAGVLGRVTVEDMLRVLRTDRASGSDYPRADFGFDDFAFSTKEHGLEIPVDSRNAKAFRNYLDAEMVSGRIVQHAVMQNLEIRIAAILNNTATGYFQGATNYLDATATGSFGAWDVYATADPIAAVIHAKEQIRGKSGLLPNSVTMGWRAFEDCRNCEKVLDRIAARGAGGPIDAASVNEQHLATVFDVDEVIVARGVKNTANKGQAASISSIWDENLVLVSRVARTESFEEPCIGRIMHWGADGSRIGGAFETYRDEARRANIVRCRMDTDEKELMKLELGYVLKVD